MTTISPMAPVVEPVFRIQAVDLYRDLHRGICAELFVVTGMVDDLVVTER